MPFPGTVDVPEGRVCAFDSPCASGAGVVCGQVSFGQVDPGQELFFAEVGVVSIVLALVAFGGGCLDEGGAEAAELGADGHALSAEGVDGMAAFGGNSHGGVDFS